MSMVGFPLLLIPLAVYNIIVFLMPGVALAEPLFTLPMPSGAGWQVTLGDILLTIGIFVLLLELIKGARPGAKYLVDHLLSLLVCGGAIAEFLLLPRFANSTFFLLSLLALTEFLSGLALRTRRGAPAMVSARRSSPAVEPRESQARHEREVQPEPPPPTPRPPAPAHVEPVEPVQPVEHHDPVPVILERETVPPSSDLKAPEVHADEDPPRPPATPH